jgi:hypothetical protein
MAAIARPAPTSYLLPLIQIATVASPDILPALNCRFSVGIGRLNPNFCEC